MANQQQDLTADRLRAIYAAAAQPREQAPSAVGSDDLDARWAARSQRPRVAPPQQQLNQNTGDVGDFLTNLEIGARQIPGMVAGLADIPLGIAGFDRPVSRLSSAVGSAVGVDNKSAIERLRSELSPKTQASQAAVRSALDSVDGFFPTMATGIAAYATHPRALISDVTTSLPATVAGGGLGGAIAKGAAASAARYGGGRVSSALSNRAVAAGVGEGSLAAGAQMDQIDKDVSARRAATSAIATGIATSVIAGKGAALATKYGFGDPDLVFVGGRTMLAEGVKRRKLWQRIGMGAVSEGVLQEMPQGAFEQLAQNWAEDKPLLEGVPEATVSSLMTGMGMGAGAGAANIGGPKEFVPPTQETPDAADGSDGGAPPPRGREQVTDKKLVGGIVTMAQLLDEAATPEQRKIITQHLREAQAELKRRGIDKSIVDKAASEANFAKISERLDKNIARQKGLAAMDVDAANDLQETIDSDIENLVQIERIHPGTRVRYMDNTFASKLDTLKTLAARVQKNQSKKSRATKATKERNKAELEAARLELEVLLDDHPELADRYEATLEEVGEDFDPLEQLGEELAIGPEEAGQIAIVPPEEVVAPEVADEAAPEQPAATKKKGKKTAKKSTPEKSDAPVRVEQPAVEDAAEPDEAERVAKESERRAAQAEPTTEDAAPRTGREVVTERSGKLRLEQLLRATQSTAGLPPEPAAPAPKPTDSLPAPAKVFADRVTEPSTRKMYIKKDGTLSARGQLDLEKFESMDVSELREIQQENLKIKDRGPLVRAQYDLIQAMLDTTKAGAVDAEIDPAQLEPLTQDEMSNIIIDAQNTGDPQKDLTDKQLKYFQLFNQYSVIEGKRNPYTHMRLHLWNERGGANKKMLDESTLRKQVTIAADKIAEAVRIRRGLGSRRAAEQLLGPQFAKRHDLEHPTASVRQQLLQQVRKTGTADDIAIAEARAEIMSALEQDIDQPGAESDAPGISGEFVERNPNALDGGRRAPRDDLDAGAVEVGEEGDGDLNPMAHGLSTRGSAKEAAPFVAGTTATKKRRFEELVEFKELVQIMDATPKEAKKLMEFADKKDALQDDIDMAQMVVNNYEDMADNLARFHARPDFDALGRAWDAAARKSKKKARWAAVRNDPWILDRWTAFYDGVQQELTEEQRENAPAMFFDAREIYIDQNIAAGGWNARVKAAAKNLAKLEKRKEALLNAEANLIKKLGGKVEKRTQERDAPPTAPGPAPTINYRRRVRRESGDTLPVRKVTRTQAAPKPLPKPKPRPAPPIEPSAVSFTTSPFVAGSMRTHNPDLEVAEIFANPKKAADEGTYALLVTTTADKFLERVAEMQAEDMGADQADRLRALKTTGYSGAKAALEAGRMLTAPTLDRRLGAVRGVDHVLANISAGSNKVHYVELVSFKQLKGVNAYMNRAKAFTHRVIGAQNATIPAETAAEAAEADKAKSVRTPYTLADHERQKSQGAFRNNPAAERASLDAALRNASSPEEQALIDEMQAALVKKPRLSVVDRPVDNPSTVEQIMPALERYVPRGRRNAVRVVQSLVELESYIAQHNISIPADAKGFTHNGRVFLIADNIEAGTAGGVLMHEVGVHLSMQPEQINKLAAAVRDMAAKGNDIANRALSAVDAAADTIGGYGAEVTDLDVNHEVVAYFVEDAVNSGIDPTKVAGQAGPVGRFFRELGKLIRTAMRTLGLQSGQITAQDIVDAAYGAADTIFRDPVYDPTPRMSRSMRERVSQGYDAWLKEKPRARRYLATLKHHSQRVGQRFFSSHDFADVVSKLLPAARDYFRVVAKRVTARGKFDAELQKHLNKARKFTKAQYDAVNEYFIASQVKEAWGFTPHEGALKPTKIDRELEATFNKMAPEQQQFIRESFEMADRLQQQREEVMRNEVEQSNNDLVSREPDPNKRVLLRKQAAADLDKFDKEFRTRKVAWMPLRRHGEYAAVFISEELRTAMDQDPLSQEVREMKGDPSHYVVEFHSSVGNATTARDRLMANSTRPGAVRSFTRQDMLSSTELIPANFMNAMRANIETAMEVSPDNKEHLLRAWTKLYIEQLGETSIRKSELERRHTAGFDRDMIKNFTQYGSALGGTISGIQMGRETHAILQRLRSDARAFDDRSQERSDALNELLDRHAAMLDPEQTPVQDKIMGWVSLNMLLSSPAYFLVNSTQTVMLTMPILAGNFGLDQTVRRMSKNYSTVAKAWKAEHSFAPGKLSQLLSGELADLDVIRREAGDDAADMMVELQQLGLFDIGIAADLGAFDNSQNRVSAAVAKAHRGLTHAVRTVEVFNRGVTALAAFQMATAHPEKVPVGADGKRPSPRAYAIKVVLETQGNYAKHNAPSIIRKLPFGKLLAQFRIFQLIQIGLLVRTVYQSFAGAGRYEKEMARRQLAYILGTHFVAGGALELPIANIAGMVFALFNDGDEPDDLEVRLRQEIGDPGVADLLLKGLPAVWDVDVGARVGMGQTFSVLPFTDLKLTRDSTNAAIGALFFGATGATAGQIADAVGQLQDGNYGNAIAGALPRGGRDVVRAFMYASEGYRRRNPTRDTAISAEEFSAFDLFMQGIGLPTTTITGMQSRNRFYQNYKQLVADRSSVIKGDYVRAFEANDAVAMQEARNEWNALQAARVRNGFRRQSPGLLTRAIRDKRKRERAAVDGVFVDRSERRFLDLMN